MGKLCLKGEAHLLGSNIYLNPSPTLALWYFLPPTAKRLNSLLTEVRKPAPPQCRQSVGVRKGRRSWLTPLSSGRETDKGK